MSNGGTKPNDILQVKTEGGKYQAKIKKGTKYQIETEEYEDGTKANDIPQFETKGGEYQAKTKKGTKYQAETETEGIGVKNLNFLYQAENGEYQASYQAETETEGIGNKDLSFLYQAESEEYEAGTKAKTKKGTMTDFCQAETETRGKKPGRGRGSEDRGQEAREGNLDIHMS